jgi:hypothetical protein
VDGRAELAVWARVAERLPVVADVDERLVAPVLVEVEVPEPDVAVLDDLVLSERRVDAVVRFLATTSRSKNG